MVRLQKAWTSGAVRRLGIKAALAALLMVLTAAPARAQLTFELMPDPVNVNAGSTGNTFDVVLDNQTGSAVLIQGFTLLMTVDANAGITFTMATTDTTAKPYIFANNSLLGPRIDSTTGPNATPGPAVNAGDLTADGNNTTVAAGAVVGIAHVSFDVAPGASGPVAVTFDQIGTSVSDQNGTGLPNQSWTNGTINVGTSAVPEPTTMALSLTMLAVGSGCAGWNRLRSRRKAG